MPWNTLTLTIRGKQRTAKIWTPGGQEPPGGWPVFMGCHGRTDDPDNFRSKFVPFCTPSEAFAAIFPISQLATDGMYRWKIPEQTVDPSLGIDYEADVEFLNEIRLHLATTKASGPLFVGGWSGGAKMSHRAMLHEPPNRFAGFWSGGKGLKTVLATPSFTPVKPIRMYWGKDDDGWFTGSQDEMSGAETFEHFCAILGGDPGDRAVQTVVNTGCANTTPAKLWVHNTVDVANWVVVGQGHAFTECPSFNTAKRILAGFGLM